MEEQESLTRECDGRRLGAGRGVPKQGMIGWIVECRRCDASTDTCATRGGPGPFQIDV
jgi:hypothetical protein